MNNFVFQSGVPEQSALRETITSNYRKDENLLANELLQSLILPESVIDATHKLAHKLVIAVRQQRLGKGGIDAFMYEYDLSGEEGIALMCLAEAMLRIPDQDTIDSLIRDKITGADWQSHLKQSESMFVNAASWGLMLSGKLLHYHDVKAINLKDTMMKWFEKASEPVIRRVMSEAMKIMSRQFVMGRDIEEALKNSRALLKDGYRFSYDMLGEAARTAADAERYFKIYQEAVEAVGTTANGQGTAAGPGVSIKLSALHPRFELGQQDKCMPIILERMLALTERAKHFDIGLTIDMEEADRLDLSLDILETLSGHASLKGWDGLGLAIQAYQKRTHVVVDWLNDLAHRHKRRFMVRLVKGAYWDYEIKDSQVRGLNDYPVFTRKVTTDVSYLTCAKKIIASGSKIFYPQFGTHNAYTVAAIISMMGQRRDFEFQRLKGMGDALYDQITPADKLGIPCRIYAPVGKHQDLLPYLVRRLLENGANTSFVNRIIDEDTPVEKLVAYPVEVLSSLEPKRNPRIPLPQDLYGSERRNSTGLDLSNLSVLKDLATKMEKTSSYHWRAYPTLGQAEIQGDAYDVKDPSNTKRIIGSVVKATPEDVKTALDRATPAFKRWTMRSVEDRAQLLEKTADLFEINRAELMAMAVREAGKTIPDALGEVREAVDFCRYYAALARRELAAKTMPGPTGEINQLQMHGRGTFLCISPWNFPLAIFTGQVVAALAAGNTVIAKPAEQTSLIAAKAVALMHEAGIPDDVIQLLPGSGRVIGGVAIPDERVSGIMFTGSTETAQIINRGLAERKGAIVPFIAETGGQNAMIVDSSALTEQVIADVTQSAFNSAGQRCSALRILFVQEDVADRTIEMLKGAMAEMRIGDPALLSSDIGPVIDQEARATLEAHARKMGAEGKLIFQMPLGKATHYGTYFAPCAFEIQSLQQLTREVFGPILHVIRYKASELDRVIDDINATGYGLTLGIHTRIDSQIEYIHSRCRVGNAYVNRNMIGAVVGVQPFGGEGLSGTGPKAGGPHYLSRLCNERTLTINTTAAGGNATLMAAGD